MNVRSGVGLVECAILETLDALGAQPGGSRTSPTAGNGRDAARQPERHALSRGARARRRVPGVGK